MSQTLAVDAVKPPTPSPKNRSFWSNLFKPHAPNTTVVEIKETDSVGAAKKAVAVQLVTKQVELQRRPTLMNNLALNHLDALEEAPKEYAFSSYLFYCFHMLCNCYYKFH
jgi:hypothetical protein